MNIHSLGTYPMYLTERNVRIEQELMMSCDITCYSVDKINIGDTYCHKSVKNNLRVVEILEERPAKGNHSQPTIFYRLKLQR